MSKEGLVKSDEKFGEAENETGDISDEGRPGNNSLLTQLRSLGEIRLVRAVQTIHTVLLSRVSDIDESPRFPDY